MKKVLIIISGLHFQNDEGAKNRLNSFINSYVENHIEVKVLLFYSLFSIKHTFNKAKFLNQNAKWYLFPVLPIGYNILVTKISNLFSQLIFCIFCRSDNFDLIQCEVNAFICRFKRKKDFLVVDFHGDSVAEFIFRNKYKNPLLIKQFIYEQSKSLEYADYVIGVSEGLIKQLEINTKYSISNYSIISCGVDIGRFLNNKNSVLKINLDERIKVGYLGGLQKWQNIDAILTLIESLRKINDKIFFILFTNNKINSIVNRLDNIGSENYLVKSLDYSEVPIYLKQLDAGLLIRENSTLNKVSSPTKIAEYLAAGVPVICTKFSGDFERSINHFEQGFVLSDVSIPENELIKLNDYLVMIKNDRETFRKLCLEKACERTWNSEFYSFLNRINNLKI